ncbi:uncharacterized protein LOC126899131 isoform X2 [Daktulosphaira vitifoliae]|uniref:uncharacterized protein LOC126899131 isoform X2 n=1 Tax=Daktulosphaira vitifoliae TaxID=58002 RepID=UPI0021AA838A|nr:uncharacterized protein LOC126899131 isoform X2 [Daktulosphaira vitifoliae]
MIVFKIFISIIVYTKCSISMDPLELHCNFSKYFLNYFKYSEQYLVNFENTISELELRNYGLAIKSHDEIIMIMLDALWDMDEVYIAEDLMTINLYLNNVSGSLNMIAKNENGEFSRTESSQNLLQGYKLINRTIVERLEYFINSKCSDVSFNNNFIAYTHFKVPPISYMPDILLRVLEQLKNNIFIVLNEYLLWYDADDTEILKSYTVIVKHLALSFRKQSYNNFNPKKFLFYDLMETRSNFCELELSTGSQAKQTASYIENKEFNDVLDIMGIFQIERNVSSRYLMENRPRYLKLDLASDSDAEQYIRHNCDKQLNVVLDMVRYVPLRIESSNNYQIKLFDVFRFIKFDFDLNNVQIFKNLLNIATVRPILLIIRFYCSLVRKFLLIYKFRNMELKQVMENLIIEMGLRTVEIMKFFIDLNLFEEKFTNKIEHIFNIMYELVSSFKERNKLFKSTVTRIITKQITENNIINTFYLAVAEVNKLALFNLALKKYQYCYKIAKRYIPTGHNDIYIFKHTLKYNIPIEQLGNYEDIYRQLYFPDDNSSYINKHYSHSSSDENDEMNNDDNKDFEVASQKYYTPKYLVDYLLYE